MGNAYDAKAEKNQFPKMLYQGTNHKTIENADDEEKARKDGWTDTPSGKIQPKSHSTASPTVPGAADPAFDARLKGLEARIEAMEAEVFPQPKKGK